MHTLATYRYVIVSGLVAAPLAKFDATSDEFKAAVFGGDPWFILCHNGTG